MRPQSCSELSRVAQSCPELLRAAQCWPELREKNGGQTDRQTDQLMDTPSHRDARTQLKMEVRLDTTLNYFIFDHRKIDPRAH